MGLDKKGESGGRRVFAKVRMGKVGEDPTIQLTEKVDGEWKVVEEFASAKGNIKSVKTSENSHEKFGKFRDMIITLEEPMEDPVVLEVPLQYSTTGLANSLLNCELGRFVTIQPGYRKKKDSGLAKTVWITGEDGKTISWAHEMSDLPEVKVVELKGQRIVDDELRLDWFMAKLNEKFGKAEEPQDQPEPATSGTDDDLPF